MTGASEPRWTVEQAFDVSPVPAVIVASDGAILMSNDAFRRLFDGALTDVPRSLSEAVPADDADEVDRFCSRGGSGDEGGIEVRLELGHRAMPVELRRGMLLGAPCDAVVVQLLDLTSRRRREAELLEDAHVDELSGLLNRRGFNVVARQLLELAKRDARWIAFLFIDVDGLKAINDEHGHRAGDEAIRAAASLLQEAFRHADALCRFGGDEFCVLALTSSEGSAAELRTRLETAVARHNDRGAGRPLSLSIGLVNREPSALIGVDLTQLVAAADAAMYEDRRQARAKASSSTTLR